MPVRPWTLAAVAALCALPAAAQNGGAARDSAARDSLARFALTPIEVTANRSTLPLSHTANAVATLDRDALVAGKTGVGLSESLRLAPGIYAANRYNFSLDERISIRGFGARSAFALRGIKVVIDGIPQTLPDGQGQLTNLELGEAQRVEIVRGSSSALFGNASGGVISISTDALPPRGAAGELRFVGGGFDRDFARSWSKWLGTVRLPLGAGVAQVTASRLAHDGIRQHSAAEQRNVNARLSLPWGNGWSLSALAELGDAPKADNPGALTAAELAANRDTAAAINLTRVAGKDVSQAQAGVTLRHRAGGGHHAALTLFALARDLENPQTFAYIDLERVSLGARVNASVVMPWRAWPHTLTVGLDYQRQRDIRANTGNNAGVSDGVLSLDQTERVTELGPFLQSALDVTRWLTFTAGGRYDRVRFQVEDRFITATNPDDSGERTMQSASGFGGLAARVSGTTTLYANVGTSFETPTTTELTNRPTGAGGFNPTLNPQKAVNYEAGARGVLAARVAWSVALYHVNVTDELISQQVPAVPGRVFYQNAGKARHRGVELGARVSLLPALSMQGSYTYSAFRYTEFTKGTRVLDGRLLPGVPQHWLTAVARAGRRDAGPWGELELTHSSSVLVDDTLDVRAAAWSTVTLRAGATVTLRGTTLRPFVAVSNLFDTAYVSSVAINGANGRYYEPAPGRNAYVGVAVEFGGG